MPGFRGTDGKVGAVLSDWPAEPFIRTCYCCSTPRQVIMHMLLLQQSAAGRVFIAGEHASPPFFGFMENASRPGLVATARIGVVAGATLPAAVGVLAGTGVRRRIPRRIP